MSDGGRERASLEVEVWKSSQKWSVQRSAVRSIAWLDLLGAVSIFWVFGQLTMVAVTPEENPESQAPGKSLAATRAVKRAELRARQRIQEENEKKADEK
jgi:hypothetical protein